MGDCLQNSYFMSKLFILKFYNLQNIYIFIKKYFPFQKKYFLYAIKNFFEAKFHLFCTKNLQFFLQKKIAKNHPKKFFKVFFGQNAKKNLTRAPAAQNENYPLFLFFFLFSSVSRNFFCMEFF